MIVNQISALNVNNKFKKQNNNPFKIDNFKGASEPNYAPANVLQAQSLFRLSSVNNKNNVSFQGLVLKPNLFKDLAVTESHPNWLKLIKREVELYKQPSDTRSEFTRDYDRILHSEAYNRMSGKTQVWSLTNSDITSTRIHHVNQVASVAEELAEFFGLNVKLTRAMAIGHDVGHSPFGHTGEVALAEIVKEHGLGSAYYHEKNSLRFLDDVETRLDPQGQEQNLSLTYGVRDGIVSHCGEIDENGLKPRAEYIDLRTIQKSNRPQPFTQEGCVMKISDKIAYLGKDIEDAVNNKFLHPDKLKILKKTIKDEAGLDFEEINNTVLINHFVYNLKANSNPQEGLKLSERSFKLINTVKKFNYEHIYGPKDKIQNQYLRLVINSIFDKLNGLYDGKNTLTKLEEMRENQPTLAKTFREWLVKYSDIAPEERAAKKYDNKVLYSIENSQDYKLAAVEFISGMTDRFAKKSFEEITFFG